MSKGETLRALVTERLTAAAEEIFALVEKTIAVYEEELCRSKEENQKRQELLEEALSPKVRTQTTDVQTQTETRPQLLEEVLSSHSHSSDVQIQTESPIKPLFVKQEDEGSPDVTCVIVKSEGDDSDVEERVEFPASDHQTGSEADVVEVLEENSEVPASDRRMETEDLTEDHGSGPTIHRDTAPQNTSPQTTALQITEPETAEPETAEPETADPETADPETAEPETAEPETAEPETAEPETPDPETAEPETAEPETAEPETPDPETAEPETELETTAEPETPDPEITELETTEPQSAAELEPVEPETTEPQTNMGSVDFFNSDMADEAMKLPGGKRKRRKPKRLIAADEEEKLTNEKRAGAKSVKRGRAEAEAHPTKDSEHSPGKSKCAKSTSKSPGASVESVTQSPAFTGVKGGSPEFRCSSCDRVFTRLHHLERHILIHTGERSFCCSVCDKSFRLKQHLISHMTIHREERLFSCPVCPQKFKHFQIKTERQDEAGPCLDGLWSDAGVGEREERLPDFTAAGAMSNEQTGGDADCDDWSYDWQPQPGSSRQPMDTDDEENEPLTGGKKAAAKGGKAGSDAEGKVKHECPVCLKKLGRKQELKRHMLLHTGEKPFSCPVCDKRFIQKSNLKSHIVTHMDSVDTIIRFQKPMETSRGEGDDWGGVEGDLGSSPREKLTDNPSDSDDDEEDWARVMEGAASGSSRQTETGDDDDQDAGSLERISLLLHQALNESKARGKTTEFQCPMCDKIFGRMENLRRHLLVHTGEKAFSCPVCNKQFTLKQHLKLHMVLHTRDQQFACSVCSKTFIRKDNLRSHMRIHSTDRPFGCSQCGARFYTDQDLARHTAHHTGERPFVCPVCNSGFLSRRYLNRHVKIHKREEEKAGKSREQSVDGLN